MHSNKVGSKPYTLKTKSITNKLYSKALKQTNKDKGRYSQ